MHFYHQYHMGCIGVILYDVAVILQLTVARSIAMYRVFSELARDVALSGKRWRWVHLKLLQTLRFMQKWVRLEIWVLRLPCSGKCPLNSLHTGEKLTAYG